MSQINGYQNYSKNAAVLEKINLKNWVHCKIILNIFNYQISTEWHYSN